MLQNTGALLQAFGRAWYSVMRSQGIYSQLPGCWSCKAAAVSNCDHALTALGVLLINPTIDFQILTTIIANWDNVWGRRGVRGGRVRWAQLFLPNHYSTARVTARSPQEAHTLSGVIHTNGAFEEATWLQVMYTQLVNGLSLRYMTSWIVNSRIRVTTSDGWMLTNTSTNTLKWRPTVLASLFYLSVRLLLHFGASPICASVRSRW